MKSIKIILGVFITLCFLFMNTSTFAQGKICKPPPPLGDLSQVVGIWSGEYSYQGEVYDLEVNLKVENEELVATTALSEFKIVLTEFKTWICPSNEIHFSYTLPNKHTVEFNGRPSGGEFTGQFRFKEHPDLCVKSNDKFSLVKNGALATKQ